jgi:medium-chain acyl-[acyl-carrier-protein] hydrolase
MHLPSLNINAASAHSGRPVPKKPPQWLATLAPRPQARIRLFCFPYAGGDALAIFRKWPELLPPAIEVCPVQIPGRGIRVAEPPFTNLILIVKAIGEAIQHRLDKPFIFFGHSMGAMISFELARLLRKERGIEPLHLFVSGRRAPQVPDLDPPTYNLPEPEFLEELKRINGTPKEALEHPELMNLMLPILQADFQVCQTHMYVSESPLSCPITAFGGLEDEATREELEAWNQQTVKRFSLHMFPGDHFFLRAQQSTLLRILTSQLADVISGK